MMARDVFPLTMESSTSSTFLFLNTSLMGFNLWRTDFCLIRSPGIINVRPIYLFLTNPSRYFTFRILVISMAAARAESIVGEAPAGGFSLQQAAKDMELVGSAFGTGVVGAVRDLTRAGLEMGFGDLDVSCLGAVVRNRDHA